MHARIQEFAPMRRHPHPLRPADRLRRRRSKLGFEQVEDRLLLAPMIFTVTDNGDLHVTGKLTLREAITMANGDGNPTDVDTIQFNLSGSQLTIMPLVTALPAITQPVTING